MTAARPLTSSTERGKTYLPVPRSWCRYNWIRVHCFGWSKTLRHLCNSTTTKLNFSLLITGLHPCDMFHQDGIVAWAATWATRCVSRPRSWKSNFIEADSWQVVRTDFRCSTRSPTSWQNPAWSPLRGANAIAPILPSRAIRQTLISATGRAPAALAELSQPTSWDHPLC